MPRSRLRGLPEGVANARSQRSRGGKGLGKMVRVSQVGDPLPSNPFVNSAHWKLHLQSFVHAPFLSPSLGGSQALANAVARGLKEAIGGSRSAAPSVAGISGSAFDRKVYKPFGNRGPSFELTLVNGVPTSWMV